MTPQPLFVAEWSSEMRSAIVSICARAVATGTPDVSLATAKLIEWKSRFSVRAVHVNGVQSSVPKKSTVADAGMTPMIVKGSPSTRTERPTIAASDPKRVDHRWLLRIATRGAPAASSPATKVRPSMGRMPNTSKYSADTRRPRTDTAVSEVAMVAAPNATAAIASNAWLCVFQSR